MQTIFNKIQQWSWLRSLLMIGIGAWITLAPRTVFRSLIWLLVVILVIQMIINFVAAYQVKRETGNYGTSLVNAIIDLVLLVLVPTLVAPLMSMGPLLIGIILIIYGISYILNRNRRQQYVNVSPIPNVIYGSIIIIVGLIMAFNPFGTVMVLFRVFGVILIIMGVMQLIDLTQAH